MNRAKVRCKWAVFIFFPMKRFGPCPTPPGPDASSLYLRACNGLDMSDCGSLVRWWELSKQDSGMLSFPNSTIYFQLFIQTLKTIISCPVLESDLRGQLIVRLIDHLPGAGTQHQPTYQTNGNMIIIITQTNHRLTSFSLDCHVRFAVIVLQLLA